MARPLVEDPRGRPAQGLTARPAALDLVAGAAAIAAPALHTATDVMEWLHGFSALQLGLNYLAFVPMGWLLLGLWAVHEPRPGAAGLAGAVLYGAAFTYFAHTALYALAERIPDCESLWRRLGGLYTPGRFREPIALPQSGPPLCYHASTMNRREDGPAGDPEMAGIPTDFVQLEVTEQGLDWGDVSLIRERLAMTPTERLQAAQNLMNAVLRIRSSSSAVSPRSSRARP